MDYAFSRRDFLKCSSAIVLTISAASLSGCSSSGSSSNIGQVSGTVDEDGNKLIVNEVNVSIGKEYKIDNNYTYIVEDFFSSPIPNDSQYCYYGCHILVSSSIGGFLFDDNFNFYVDGQPLTNLTVDCPTGLDKTGSHSLMPGSSTKVTITGKALHGGQNLKVKIKVRDQVLSSDSSTYNTRTQIFLICQSNLSV